MIQNPFQPGGVNAAPGLLPPPGGASPYSSLMVAEPPADLQEEQPGNDVELRDYIAKAGRHVELSGGKPSKASSDNVYRTLHGYTKRNPTSELGKNVLAAAHANKPDSHTFPALK